MCNHREASLLKSIQHPQEFSLANQTNESKKIWRKKLLKFIKTEDSRTYGHTLVLSFFIEMHRVENY